jgi:hypothetical protein
MFINGVYNWRTDGDLMEVLKRGWLRKASEIVINWMWPNSMKTVADERWGGSGILNLLVRPIQLVFVEVVIRRMRPFVEEPIVNFESEQSLITFQELPPEVLIGICNQKDRGKGRAEIGTVNSIFDWCRVNIGAATTKEFDTVTIGSWGNPNRHQWHSPAMISRTKSKSLGAKYLPPHCCKPSTSANPSRVDQSVKMLCLVVNSSNLLIREIIPFEGVVIAYHFARE